MKKLCKVLSLILVITLSVSAFSLNSSAAGNFYTDFGSVSIINSDPFSGQLFEQVFDYTDWNGGWSRSALNVIIDGGSDVGSGLGTRNKYFSKSMSVPGGGHLYLHSEMDIGSSLLGGSSIVIDGGVNLSSTVSRRPDSIFVCVVPSSVLYEINNLDNSEFYKAGFDNFISYYKNHGGTVAQYDLSAADMADHGSQYLYVSFNMEAYVPVDCTSIHVILMASYHNTSDTSQTINAYLAAYDLHFTSIAGPLYDSVRSVYDRYEEESRHDEIMGDDNGGLKGIFKKLGEIPGQISSFISGLGDRISGFFTNLANSIKGFFEKLVEDIKGLFIPPDGFFDEVKGKFNTLLTDHLGFIMQSEEIVSNIITQLRDFKPYDSENAGDYEFLIQSKTYTIDVGDGSTFDITDEGGEGSDFILIPDEGDGYYHIKFDWLDRQPFKAFYVFYRAAVIFIVVLGIVNLGIRKYNQVFGGGGD